MKAFKLFTGPDNASHLIIGTLDLDHRTDTVAVHFKELPPHSAFDCTRRRNGNMSSRSPARSNSPRAMAKNALSVRAKYWWRPIPPAPGTNGD